MEIKARISDLEHVRQILQNMGAEYHGADTQCDTYFNSPNGRMKIRKGTIENCLVWYMRPNSESPKTCDYHLISFPPESSKPDELIMLLTAALGVWAKVEKVRDIYYIENIKIHLDNVSELGSYMEIEVIGAPDISEKQLYSQCEAFLSRFEIPKEHFISCSYSDLISDKI